MSGLVAMYNVDGRPVDPAQLARMSEAIAPRGPDGQGAWVNGPIGLAHRLLHITPESHRERQPVSDREGRYHLVWDGRLDNRAELLEDLHADSDPELVLEAFQRWDVACVHHLIGEFAFVVWDAHTKRLFCARDRMGVRPLQYGWNGSTLVISSDIKPILSVLDRMPEPDDEMVVAFLTREFREGDQTRTFFQGIHRVPAASCLLIKEGQTRLHTYWSLDLSRQIDYDRDEDYIEQFRDLFNEAVRCRLRSDRPIGCALSGGLDSSSIACVAARQTTLPLEAVTAVGEQLVSNEGAYASEVIRQTGMAFHEYARPTDEPLNDLAETVWKVESPLVATNRRSGQALIEWLRKRNCRIILTGVGGDQILDEYGYFADLLIRRPWRFLQELRVFANQYGAPPMTLTGVALRHALSPSMKYWAKRMTRRAPPAWINSSLAHQTNLRARIREPRLGRAQPVSFAQAESYLEIYGPYRMFVFEVEERAASYAGCEIRYPFLDSRLVEFLLSIPWEKRTRQGQRKWLLRQAMDGLVPEAILTRQGKGDYTSSMDESLRALCHAHPPAPLENRSGRMDHYLNFAKARTLIDRFRNGSPNVRWSVWSLVALDYWLDAFWNRSRNTNRR